MKFFTTRALRPRINLSEGCSGDIVFIPGLLSTSAIWVNQASFLSTRDTTITYANTYNSRSIDEMACKILHTLSPQKFIIVAHSMGCYPALKMAQQAPDRVQGLILINVTIQPPSLSENSRKLAIIKKISACSETEFKNLISHKFFANQTFYPLSPDQEAILIKMAIDIGPVEFVNQLKSSLGRGDLRPVFQQIIEWLPITLINSINDKIIPAPSWREIIGKKASSYHTQIIESSDTGHLIPLEKPELVNEVLSQKLVLSQKIS